MIVEISLSTDGLGTYDGDHRDGKWTDLRPADGRGPCPHGSVTNLPGDGTLRVPLPAAFPNEADQASAGTYEGLGRAMAQRRAARAAFGDAVAKYREKGPPPFDMRTAIEESPCVT